MSLFGRPATSAALPSPGLKDVEVPNPPTDSISSLAFSSAADYLAVGSWSNEVRMYEVNADGQSSGKASYQHEGPVLSVCWNKEGNKVLSGGADNAIRMFDVTTGQATQVGQHDAPVKNVKWIDAPQPAGGILASGSWDKTVKYWDLRTPNPVASVQLPERCYTMDVAYPLLVVGTAEKHIQIYNLTNPTTVYKSVASPLKWQTKVLSCFPSGTGFAVGSIEGRIAVQNVEEKDAKDNFSFRCHRKEPGAGSKDPVLVYAVNDIIFHQQHGTFATAGSDGTISYWDKDSRTRLKTFDAAPGPVTATAFNRTGMIYAYSVSYDWSKGHGGMTPGFPNKIMLHAVKEEEVRKRPRVRKTTQKRAIDASVKVSMADGKEFRLFDEILELVVSHALGDGIHGIMTQASTAAMDFKTKAKELLPNGSRANNAGGFSNNAEGYRFVLDIARVCRQFRSEVERQLGILCPRMFSLEGSVFLGGREKKIIIDFKSLPHPLLQRLSTLLGISEACMMVGTLGSMNTLSIVNTALPLLWRKEPAVRTPLAMVYIGFANQHSLFSTS